MSESGAAPLGGKESNLSAAPPVKVRDRVDEEAAPGVFAVLWDRADYRKAVREAFVSASPGALEHLYLAHVPDTNVWLSYVLNGTTHTIHMAHIDTLEPARGEQ